MRRLVVVAMAMSILGAGVTRYEAGSQIREIDRGDRFLTDRVRILTTSTGTARELKFGQRSLGLSDRQAAGLAGESVFLITAEEDGSRVQLFSPDGTERFAVDVPAGRQPIPFAGAIAIVGRAEHEPDLAYDIEISHEGGSRWLTRPRRRILDLAAIDGFLAVASVDPVERTARTELIDSRGRVAHVFDSADSHRPRPAVAGSDIAAVIPRGGGATLALAVGGGPEVRFELPYRLTDLAFLDDGTGLLLWGANDHVLVDLPDGGIRWAGSLVSGRQLSSPGSSIARIGGVLTLAVREELPDGTWRVSALPIDAATGSKGERRLLFEAPSLPTDVTRIRRGDSERLVFSERVFSIVADP